MALRALGDYGISPERGFLCPFDASTVAFEAELQEVRAVALRLPELLPSGAVRASLDQLIEPPASAFEALDHAQARIAMVHYSFLVQAYVWGEPEAATALPRSLAVPIVTLADRLGQQPLLQYSGYVLDNWARLDPAGEVSLHNLYMVQKFPAGTPQA